MVSPGEPGPIVHTALLISQWGSVQSAPRFSFLFFSFPPSPFPFPLPSLSFPFFPPFVDWVSSSGEQAFGFLHHCGLLLTSAPDFWLCPSTNVLRSLVTCMLFHSGKEALLSWDTGIMGAIVSHPEPALSTAGSAADTQSSNSLKQPSHLKSSTLPRAAYIQWLITGGALKAWPLTPSRDNSEEPSWLHSSPQDHLRPLWSISAQLPPVPNPVSMSLALWQFHKPYLRNLLCAPLHLRHCFPETLTMIVTTCVKGVCIWTCIKNAFSAHFVSTSWEWHALSYPTLPFILFTLQFLIIFHSWLHLWAIEFYLKFNAFISAVQQDDWDIYVYSFPYGLS